eukprot:TRINITY_DN257_c0_g2_i1.p1 TRINITY_DN257_c0_g2~~TRINITY_DN257_c0_g2_i1.p1  ORF type:complete len:274 (-),score=48.50 TRINITY_DN257_c0_g2_i1:1114-1935(-)
MQAVYESLNGKWTNFCRVWPYGDRALVTAGIVVAHELAWIPYNAFLFTLMYSPKAASYFEKWKILPADQKPSERLLKKSIIDMIISHVVIFPVSTWYLVPFLQKRGIYHLGDLPSLKELLRDFAVTALLNDTLFYWAHRFLHSHPWIYKNFHSQHHRFTATIGIASEFASPVESIFANLLPTLVGLWICKSHAVTVCLWLFIRILETVDAHSGYDFPWSPFKLPFLLGPKAHDWHHSHNRGVFGVFKFWDWIMGTDAEFKKDMAAEEEKKKKQ